MDVYLHSLATLTPETRYDQAFCLELALQACGRDARLRRQIRSLYRRSGIAYRHSVIRDFAPSGVAAFFTRQSDGALTPPDTQTRNECYIRESRPLFVRLARLALEGAPGVRPRDITHLITVSCTGFYNPGPDYYIATELGLSPRAARYHVGFMGCSAFFPALKMAEAFCRADPQAVVLIVSVELCSLHIQYRAAPDALLADALFADGGGATLVSARPPAGDRPALRLCGLAGDLLPDSEQEMGWRIGDSGFAMRLSMDVPRRLGAAIRPFTRALLDAHPWTSDAVTWWAIHPGGRAILDQIQRELSLAPEALAPSRHVLREYGNMSSATMVFVLDTILRQPMRAAVEPIVALGFGPGLALEAAVLEKHSPSRAGVTRPPSAGRG